MLDLTAACFSSRSIKLEHDSHAEPVEQALEPPERRKVSRAIRAIERWKQPALQIEKKNNLVGCILFVHQGDTVTTGCPLDFLNLRHFGVVSTYSAPFWGISMIFMGRGAWNWLWNPSSILYEVLTRAQAPMPAFRQVALGRGP